eukprot:m.441941 g.441941  ORF g.441941 m.441941 type:complete len:218 (-) comp18726_c0_seq1:245-898(-)
MPKSKRSKVVTLARTTKVGFQAKETLIQEVQAAVDEYANIFVFSISDMRNSHLKDVRTKWKRSRFFLGKNKVMAKALGKTPEEEYRPGLHEVAKLVSGNVGLLFTNQDVEYTTNWFSEFGATEYSRSGNTATDTVQLPKGGMPQFSHAIEPHLRSLGMPTSLQRGVVTLDKDFEVCKAGDVLTAERARILKLLEIPMATFQVKLSHHWAADSGMRQL